MDRTAESLIREGLELPAEERLHIAERLYESVPEDDVRHAWIEEVKRRKAVWDNGAIQGIDGNHVIKELRARAK
jgi:hypothetical protein